MYICARMKERLKEDEAPEWRLKEALEAGGGGYEIYTLLSNNTPSQFSLIPLSRALSKINTELKYSNQWESSAVLPANQRAVNPCNAIFLKMRKAAGFNKLRTASYSCATRVQRSAKTSRQTNNPCKSGCKTVQSCSRNGTLTLQILKLQGRGYPTKTGRTNAK